MSIVTAPKLSQKIGSWRAIYWEPVMGSGERLCVGCVTSFEGRTRAHKAIKPGVLTALYSANGAAAESILDRGFNMLNRMADTQHCETLEAPFYGTFLGDLSNAHVDSEQELVQVALIMTSSMCNMSDPGMLDEAEPASDGGKKINHQFITRVRSAVTKLRPDLHPYFNIEAKLLTKKRPVRFGFLSNDLVAHLGLIHQQNLNGAVRNARGLMAEVHMAHIAREQQGRAAIVLGHPPLTSANLGNADREAISDSLEELRLEAAQLDVSFASGDSDAECASELVALH